MLKKKLQTGQDMSHGQDFVVVAVFCLETLFIKKIDDG